MAAAGRDRRAARRRTCAAAAAPASRWAARRASSPKGTGSRRTSSSTPTSRSRATFKDREIMLASPHRLIEGCLITAHAIESKNVFIYIRGEYLDEYEVLRARARGGARGGAARRRRRSSCTAAPAPTSAARRRRCSSRSRASAASRARGRRSRAVQGLYASPTLINNVADGRDRPGDHRAWAAPRYAKIGAAELARHAWSSRSRATSSTAGQLRARARDADARADLRPRRRHPGRARAEGGHPRRLVACRC